MKQQFWQFVSDVFGPTLALVVHEYSREGRFDNAERIEKSLLNPIQRRIGANVSNHAEKMRKERVVNG